MSPQGLCKLRSILFSTSHPDLGELSDMSYRTGDQPAFLAQMSRSATPQSPKEELEIETQQQPQNSALANEEKLAQAATNKTVDFMPNDTENPFNWNTWKKHRICILACVMTFFVQINGTMMTSAAEQINESFNVSDEVFPHSYWPVLSWNLGGAAAPLVGLPLMVWLLLFAYINYLRL